MKQEFENGKYTVIFNEKTGVLQALRYGEPWQDLSGNKMVYCMLARVEELAEQRAELLGALKRFTSYGDVFAYRPHEGNPYDHAVELIAKCEAAQ